MAVEKGEEGRAVLLYTEAACPGFLEKRLAGWSWAKGFQDLSMGLSHCSRPLTIAVCETTHPFDF